MTHAATIQPAATNVRVNRFLALVYLVMALGMGVTAVVSTWVSTNEALMKRIMYNSWFAFRAVHDTDHHRRCSEFCDHAPLCGCSISPIYPVRCTNGGIPIIDIYLL